MRSNAIMAADIPCQWSKCKDLEEVAVIYQEIQAAIKEFQAE